MDVNQVIRDIEVVAETVFDLSTRHQAQEKAGSRRDAYKKSIREVERAAGDEAAAELATWIKDYLREEKKFPSAKATRKKGAEICRERGEEISTGSYLGA